MVLFGFSLKGEETRKDSVIVSVLTCAPGSEIYELCGHAAIRIRGNVEGHSIDSVWNYGIFDFAQPNFVYRFVKGETDYQVAGYPFGWFMPEYVDERRSVYEQDLNLKDSEKLNLLKRLRTVSLPENRVYRYNYVKNNCATKILTDLDSISDQRIIYPDNVEYGTFRDEMRAYHKDYPWYQFGIDLALGSGLDLPITGRDEMFVPVEMNKKISGAHFADGTPLVSASKVLYQGVDNASLPETPWYLTPLTISIVILLLSGITAWLEVRQKRVYRLVYSIWFGICGLGGCVISFLVFVSTHEASSPNVLLWWLNPLQLLIAISVWSRKMRFIGLAMCWINVIVLGCLLLVWPFQAQSANPAFFPLMGATLLLAIAYCIVAHKNLSLNLSKRDEKNNHYGDLWTDYSERGSARRPRRGRPTQTGRGNRR